MIRRALFQLGLLIALLCAGFAAHAAVTIYAVNNDAGGILRIDSATSVSTVIYSGAPFPLGNRSAAMAQCSNGLLYFVSGGNNGTLYRFNPYTPAIAPVAIGPTGAPDMIRLSCRPATEVLYGMGTSPSTIYTFNAATGAATGIALTLPGATPPASGSGDIAFNTAGTLFFVGEVTAGTAATERLWTINLTTNTIVNVGAISGLPNVVNGIEFDNAGNLRLSVTNETRLYTVPVTGGAATAVGANGSMPAVFDLAGKDIVPNPDLSITKTDGRGFVSAGDTVTYTIVVTNNSSFAVTGTVTDAIPASISSVTWTCAASGGSTCTAASGNGNAINTTATLAAAGTATYTVTGTLSAAATGTLTNTASVALPFAFFTDNTPANNSATDTTTINQNPGIAKAFAPATIPVNGTSTLTFTLSNPNAAALSGINFTDAYPVGVVNATPLTVGGTCAGVTHTATAGGTSFNVTAGTIPGGAPGTCTITVLVTSAAFGTYNNTTSGVTTAQTTTSGAVSNTATLTVANTPPPTIAKSFSPTTIQTQGTSVLTLTITNPSATTTLTGVAVTDNYPLNLFNRTAGPTANPAISCTAGSSGTVTGGSNGGTTIGMSGGTLLPGGRCLVTVNVTSAIVAAYNNTTGAVTSTNGGTGGTASATLTLSAALQPPVISKAFSVSIMGVNQVATLTFTIRNPNNAALNNVTFSDTYPAGLVNAATPNVSSNCDNVAGGANDVTGGAAGGNTIGLGGNPGTNENDMPANSTCTVSVSVTSATANTYNNVSGAVVSGALTGNTASATIIVLNRPTLTKSFSPNTMPSNGTSVLTITLTNPNGATAITGAAFTDTYPAQITNTASPGGATTCVGGTVTAAVTGPSVALSGGTIPAGGSCTITVNVTSSTAGAHTNTIPVGGLATTNAGANTVAASAALTVVATAATIVKSAQTFSDPVNGTTNPKAIPGAFVTYTLMVSNLLAVSLDLNNTILTDAVPANTELFVGDMGVAGSGPVAFTNGVPTSGLTYTFISLASAADDVSFSNNGGTSFVYTPTPNANGVDPTVTHIRINPKGIFLPTSNFQLQFRVRIK